LTHLLLVCLKFYLLTVIGLFCSKVKEKVYVLQSPEISKASGEMINTIPSIMFGPSNTLEIDHLPKSSENPNEGVV